MDILETILFVTLFSVSGYFVYEMFKLKKMLKRHNEEQKKALTEAGNAITDTLRVAFDNLKRNSADHNKINAKLTEHNSRIHRLEQFNNRNAQDDRKQPKIIQERKDENDE